MERKEDLLTAHSLLNFELSFFVVPWKIPIFIAKQNYHIRKTILIFFSFIIVSDCDHFSINFFQLFISLYGLSFPFENTNQHKNWTDNSSHQAHKW